MPHLQKVTSASSVGVENCLPLPSLAFSFICLQAKSHNKILNFLDYGEISLANNSRGDLSGDIEIDKISSLRIRLESNKEGLLGRTRPRLAPRGNILNISERTDGNERQSQAGEE